MELTHILTHLIALTQRSRAAAEERGLKELLSPKAWLDEWSTVRIGSPRQSGHSTAIAQAVKLFEMPLVIVPYQAQVENIEHLTQYPHVVNAASFVRGDFRSCDLDAIFVDCASYMDRLITKRPYEGFWVQVGAHLERTGGLLIRVA